MLRKLFTTIILLTLPGVATLFAQEAAAPVAEEVHYYSNPLFIALSSVIVILLIFIIGLANVLKGAIDVYRKKLRTEGVIKTIIGIIVFAGILTTNAYAEEAVQSAYSDGPPAEIGGISSTIFYILVSAIFIQIGVIYILIRQIKNFLALQFPEMEGSHGFESSSLDKWNASVAVEDEASIMMDHEYDGIRELDNSLPPWWKYGFYFTIVWAFGYIIYYHISGSGDLSIAEYNKEVAAANKAVEEYRKKSANSVDENNVKLITEAAELNAGKDVFVANCAACHGQKGEGGVGPNLTDEYWMHGGSVSDVFKTIKYGVADKGMKSWKEDLSPSQIAQITGYIKSIFGTNPPNAKAPQGDKYSEGSGVAAPADSASVKDTSAVK